MTIRFKKGDKVKTINYLGTEFIGIVIEKINANLYRIEFFDSYYETYVREIVENTQIKPVFECGNYIKIINENGNNLYGIITNVNKYNQIEIEYFDNYDYGQFIFFN